MKSKAYILGMAALVAAASTGLWSCSDDFTYPPAIVPVADNYDQVNTTIAELKTKYWSTDRNYADTIWYANSEGDHVIIKGRVISSDETGNVYKSLVIQDETAALALSINATKLYASYRIGQEIVIDCTGMYIGKYNGLQQMGEPEWYTSGSTWEISFMDSDFFEEHVQVNGLPEPAKTDTIVTTIPDLKAITSAPELPIMQSQLIRLNDVMWVGGGTEAYTTGGATTSRYLRDRDGNQITIRNSAYATWAYDTMPGGYGDVVCIASYYGTDWQLLLIDPDYCIGFEEVDSETGDAYTPVPEGDGSQASPYNVSQAYDMCMNQTYTEGAKVYVEGYIYQIDEVDTGSYGNATYYISDNGAYVTTNYLEIYHGYYLDGAKFTSADQIQVGDRVVVYCELTLYNSSVPETKAYSSIYSINGETSSSTGGSGDSSSTDTSVGSGDGTLASPYDVARALAIINAGSYSSSKVYVKGKISQIDSVDTSYGNATYYISDDGTTTSQLEVYRGYYLDGAKFTSTSQIKVGDEVIVYGALTMYYSTPEITTGSSIYSLNGSTTDDSGNGDDSSSDDNSGSSDDGAGSESSPYSVAQVISLDNPGTTAWVEGYIVGWIDGMTYSSGCNFNSSATAATNLLLADSADCTDSSKCIPVQLPSGSVRTALNLQDNPGNYGKKVKLEGSLEKYFSVPGLKSVTSYVWE